MTSSFSWLDHSDKERRQVLEAIDRFSESDTRDELGIGAIRDGFADLLFPGTTVLMTRARYFLFTPWIYLDLEHRGVRDDVEARARQAEVKLIDALGDSPGTIGKLAKGTLKRLASNVYWLGLGRWGIRTFEGLQPEYHQYLSEGRGAHAALGDDEGVGSGEHTRRSWDVSIPKPPTGFPKQATFELTADEAAYLRSRVLEAAPGTMLSILLQSTNVPDVTYPWQHPNLGDFSTDLQAILAHAQCFAEVMQGAALLYNVMLAEADRRESAGAFRTRFAAWAEELGPRARSLALWQLKDFWALVRSVANVKAPTERFVNHWIELRAWERGVDVCEDRAARVLIQTREAQLKGPRARLSNRSALELWGGESGTARLDYRWPTAKRLAKDILSSGGSNA